MVPQFEGAFPFRRHERAHAVSPTIASLPGARRRAGAGGFPKRGAYTPDRSRQDSPSGTRRFHVDRQDPRLEGPADPCIRDGQAAPPRPDERRAALSRDDRDPRRHPTRLQPPARDARDHRPADRARRGGRRPRAHRGDVPRRPHQHQRGPRGPARRPAQAERSPPGGRRRRRGRAGPRGAGCDPTVRQPGAERQARRRHRRAAHRRGRDRHRRQLPRPRVRRRGAAHRQALREGGGRTPPPLPRQRRPDRRRARARRPRPRAHAGRRHQQDVHHRGDDAECAHRPRLAAGVARAGRGPEAHDRGEHEHGRGRGVRHRPGQHLRILGLGRRAVQRQQRGRPGAARAPVRFRTGGAVPRRRARYRRALPPGGAVEEPADPARPLRGVEQLVPRPPVARAAPLLPGAPQAGAAHPAGRHGVERQAGDAGRRDARLRRRRDRLSASRGPTVSTASTSSSTRDAWCRPTSSASSAASSRAR